MFCLPNIIAETLTSYKLADGTFVPFTVAHELPKFVRPLVIFG